MRNFFAVMRDSVREAVDGWVIYVMLALAAITVLIAASVSFEPDAGETAFAAIVGPFNQVFRDRGADTEEVGTRVQVGPLTQRVPIPLSYTATDVQKLDGGTAYPGKYKLRLTVAAGGGTTRQPRGGGPPVTPVNVQGSEDIFPTVVYAWGQSKPAEQSMLVKADLSGGGDAPKPGTLPQFEVVPDGENADDALAKKNAEGNGRWTLISYPKVSAKELAGVTDEMMEDFVRNQFLVHGDIPDVAVKRRQTADKGTYQFDVTADVKAGAKGWPHTTKILFGALPISQSQPFGPAVTLVQDILVNTVGASVTLLVAIILTGFFIPNMLRKGSLDLVMAKPISRLELLLYKYVGGMVFMLMISTLSVGGVWLVMALRSGNWNPTFLLSIPIITFTFAVLYAVSTLVAVLTRSAIAAILITAVFMVLMWAVGFTKSITDALRSLTDKEEDKKGWFYTTVDVTNAVLPRYNDILKLNSQTMTEAYCAPSVVKTSRRTAPPSWFPALGISLGYIAGLLALSYWRFSTRDP